jgi:hypothetical protein
MIAQIDHELVALQELKTAISQNKGISLSAGDVYTQTIELAEKKIKYEQEAKSIEAFQLVKGFDGMSKNKQASPFRYSSAGFFSGICLLIIVLFLKYFATYYRQYHQKPTS